jgi:DNA polymerase-3 subunit delta'
MTESAASALLKAIEEPGSQNIWLLCAPTTDDVLPTIKSRCRLVSLITPTTNEVSVYLQETLKVEKDRAEVAARISQGHIGSARHLATDMDFLQIRKKIIKLFLSIDSEARAITTASQLQDIAVTRSEISLKEFHKEEEEELRLTVHGPNRGLLPGGSKVLKNLEKSQKSRLVRAAKDELDSYFLWLQTLFRDALLPESSGTKLFINPDQHDEIHELRSKVSPRRLQNLSERVHQFRSSIDTNVSQILTLEVFCLDFFNLIHGH